MSTTDVGIRLNDPELPAAGTLLTAEAAEVVAPAFGERASVTALRPRQVIYRPGRRMAVRYEVTVDRGQLQFVEDEVVAWAARKGPPEGSLPVEAAGMTIGVWRPEDDPRLPGLAPASDPAFVRRLLDDLGAPAGELELETVAYRPGTRAVVRVMLGESSKRLVFRPGHGVERAAPMQMLYLKVLRPRAAEHAIRAHEALTGRAPVPRSLGYDAERGLIVFEVVPGDTLIDVVIEQTYRPPGGEELLELLESLAGVELDGEPHGTTTDDVRGFARLLRTILPDKADRLDRFEESYGGDTTGPLVTAHGDFHESQVLVDGGGVRGLLDIDDVGPGQRIDDLATLLGRLWSFSHTERVGQERLRAYTLELLDFFSTLVDERELRHRMASTLLGRATSPFRQWRRNWRPMTLDRLAVAEKWLAENRRD